MHQMLTRSVTRYDNDSPYIFPLEFINVSCENLTTHQEKSSG